MTQVFPLNYFSSIFNVKKIFALRKKMNWGQTILIFVFLMSILVMPITLFYAKETSIPSERFFNQQDKLFTPQVVEKVAELSFSKGQLENKESVVLGEDANGVFALNANPQSFAKKDYLILNQDFWLIQTKGKQFKNVYRSQFQPKDVKTPAELLQFFERNFYQSNQLTIILSYSLSLGLMLVALFFLIFLGGALFLWLARKSQFTDIKTYHEALNVMLLTYSVPIVLASGYSMFHFQITTLMGISTVLGVLVLVLLYGKTKFKDNKEGE